MREALEADIWRKVDEAQVPLTATLELTYRCNLACVHCYCDGERGEELSTPEMCAVIDQLAEAGTLELNLTGGEALLREDFFYIVGYARRQGMAVSLISNGTLIDINILQRMKQLHLLGLAISLYGASPETHEAVTGVVGSFAKTQEAILLASREGFQVTVNTSVMQQNIQEINRLEDFCTSLGVDLMPSPALTPTLAGSRRPLQYRLNDEQLRTYLRWEVASGRKRQIKKVTKPCGAGRSIVAISPRGEVFPCMVLRMKVGDLRQEKFAQVWSSSPTLQWLRGLRLEDFQECARCEFIDRCLRCQGHAYHEEGRLDSSCKELCRITILREEAIYENGGCGN